MAPLPTLPRPACSGPGVPMTVHTVAVVCCAAPRAQAARPKAQPHPAESSPDPATPTSRPRPSHEYLPARASDRRLTRRPSPWPGCNGSRGQRRCQRPLKHRQSEFPDHTHTLALWRRNTDQDPRGRCSTPLQFFEQHFDLHSNLAEACRERLNVPSHEVAVGLGDRLHGGCWQGRLHRQHHCGDMRRHHNDKADSGRHGVLLPFHWPDIASSTVRALPQQGCTSGAAALKSSGAAALKSWISLSCNSCISPSHAYSAINPPMKFQEAWFFGDDLHSKVQVPHEGVRHAPASHPGHAFHLTCGCRKATRGHARSPLYTYIHITYTSNSLHTKVYGSRYTNTSSLPCGLRGTYGST